MRFLRKACLALTAALACSAATGAQEIPAPAAKVIEELECKMQKAMPGWTRERVEPFSKTERVLVAVWSNCGRRVKVSVNYAPSEAEAARGLRRPTQAEGKVMEGLGDEAYAWGHDDTIGMRKGNLVFSISTASLTSLPGVDAGESSALLRAEAAALNKGFARLISSFLSNPNVKCGELFEMFRR